MLDEVDEAVAELFTSSVLPAPALHTASGGQLAPR
jgi:hypothetical protein